MKRSLGNDPGWDDGASVALGPTYDPHGPTCTPLWWATWHRLDACQAHPEHWVYRHWRRLAMGGTDQLGEKTCPSMFDVATSVRQDASVFAGAHFLSPMEPQNTFDVVVVEGLFQDRVNVVQLAEATGELLGPLRCLGPTIRPRAQEWRARILGRGPWSSKSSERMSRLAGHTMFGWEAPTPHAAEALALARFGWVEGPSWKPKRRRK